MVKEMIVNVDTDGTVTGLHFDEFDLGFLGNKKIGRASEIFFNEITQLWDVRVPGQDDAFDAARDFETYGEAREFEVEWLQKAMKYSTNPIGRVGAILANEVRDKLISQNRS